MAAVDLATKDDLAALLGELRQLRAAVERLQGRDEGEVVEPAEAARRLGRSLRTVERWMKSGALAVVPVGAARYVRLPPGTPQR